MNRNQRLGINARIESNLRPDHLLFSESQSRFIISIDPNNRQNLLDMFYEQSIPVQQIGTVGGDRLSVNNFFDIPVSELYDIYFRTLPDIMNS